MLAEAGADAVADALHELVVRAQTALDEQGDLLPGVGR